MNPNASPLLNSAADPPDSNVLSAAPAANRRFLYAGGTRPLEGYTIKRGVGQGGFGEIYYAVSDSGKEVALKLIRRNLEVELRGIRQCLNLKHPNLLNLFDIRQDDNGDTWVVMEYVGGLSLQDAVDAQPNGMPLDEALAWMHGISGAVAYLHDHGIVHRDLKPANIFSDDGVVKVGDYGLSKFISCSRRSGHTESIGTVHYMAPEVANGRYGKEIDVYALGIILYEVLTGRVPFDGESVGEVLMKHLTAQPDVSMLPEPYRTIVAKAMEKDPEKRYRSANEFLAALPPVGTVLPGTGRIPLGSGGVKNHEIPSSPQPAPNEAWPGARTAEGETLVAVTAVDEEPILRGMKQAWRRLVDGWDRVEIHPTLKLLILVGAVVVLVLSWEVWLPALIFSVIAYGFYRFIRWIVLSAGPQKSPESIRQTPPELARTIATPAAGQAAAAPASIRDRQRWRRPYEKPLMALVLGTPRERAADLLGSLLMSMLVSAAMMIIMVLLLGYYEGDPGPEQLAWLFVTSVVGSWTVLIPSKFWEGVKGESLPRRFLMMVLGLGLGVLACGMATWLLTQLPSYGDFVPEIGAFHQIRLPANFFRSDGAPLLPAFVTAFGTLFFAVRWWKQADPLRSTRLSIWPVIYTVLVSGILAACWHFPQPWLTMVAATISVSVQLSSPWVHPRERAAKRRG